MLFPKLKFLAKVSVYKISVVIVLFAFIINIPINLSRQAISVSFKIGSNTTTLLQTYGNILNDCIFLSLNYILIINIDLLFYFILKGPSVYTKDQIFTYSVVGANVFRDLILMIIEIILNIILVVLLKRFVQKKFRITINNQQEDIDNRNDSNKNKNKAIKNTAIIAVIMGFLSILSHLGTFMVKTKNYFFNIFS